MVPLSFQEQGEGQPLVLIHGYPMNRKVWASFADKLSRYFKVYTIDLPGFGGSSNLASPFSIASVGNIVLQWLAAKGIENSVLIGHSLGGYVALAMVKEAPERFSGFGLFHSTAVADTAEKKQGRDKVIEFVDKNGAAAFTANFIPPLFADKDHPAIARIRSISVEASADAVKGYALAMRDRPDRTDVLREYDGPILFIAGEKDQGIPADSVREQAKLCKNAEIHVLTGVAHMGMFEQEQETTEIVRAFVSRAFEINV